MQLSSASVLKPWVGLLLTITLTLAVVGCNQAGLTPTPVPNPDVGQTPGDVKYYPRISR